nr:Gag-Pol polyprotein [Tanacetum cinerariifolium]
KDCKKVKVKDYEYYKTKMLLAKKDKDEQVLLDEDQAWTESSSDSNQEINANMVFMAQIDKVLSDSEASSSSADEKISETVHMIMPSKDNLYNGRKGIGLENPKYFKKAKDLRPTLYDEKVIGLGYTLMFLTHFDEALEIEKFKRSRENKIEFAYDYGNLNASYQTSSYKSYISNVILEKIIIDLEDEVVNLLEKEKANLETIESLKSKCFELSESALSESKNQNKNDCHKIEKVCDKEENPKVIASGMFKLNVSQCVSPILMSKSSYLDTFSSVRRPKNSGVIWKKKGSSNTSNVDCPDLSLDHRFGMFKAYDGVGQFCDKGLEVAFRKYTCCVRNEDGVDLLIGDRSSNLYTIALNEVASNSLTCLLAKASSSQSWLWHQRLSHLNFATINNLVKNNLVQGFPKMKFEKDHLCSTCEQGKIHQKHHKSKTTFASNKPLYLLHMDLCGPMRVQSINGKRYVLVVVDDYSRYTWVFFIRSKDEASKKEKAKGDIKVFVGYSKESAAFRIYNKRTRKIHESVNVNFDEISEMASKQFSLEPGLSKLNETGKSSNRSILKVDEALKKDLEDLFQDFYDEYFHSSKIMKSSTTNVETAINEKVFHEVSKSFQGESSSSSLNDDVQQSPKESSVRTKGQLVNSCLFSCLLSSIEPANVAEDLRDADWVSAMQEELDQFARLKVWRLVPRSEGKSVIKTKWIFKNKKNESSLVVK